MARVDMDNRVDIRASVISRDGIAIPTTGPRAAPRRQGHRDDVVGRRRLVRHARRVRGIRRGVGCSALTFPTSHG